MRMSRYLVILFTVLFVSCSEDSPIIPEEEPFEFKEKLSEMNLFEGALRDFNPADNVFPYRLATPLFSDYTIKDRFIMLPAGTSMDYRATGLVDFPLGTVIIKNFSALYEDDTERRLETRLLHLDPVDGEWEVRVYLWNESQTEAVDHVIGATLDIRVKDEAGNVINASNYKVPNTNECKRCHNTNNVIKPIGPKIRSLNTNIVSGTTNQLDAWAADGLLTNLPSSGVPVLPDWADATNFTLDERARAYLDINCAHCHTDGGDAYYTGFFTEYEQTDSTKLGVYKIPIAAGPGSGTLTYDLVPGNADESIILFRMDSDIPAIAMPEVARSVIHEEGVELIRDWINSL